MDDAQRNSFPIIDMFVILFTFFLYNNNMSSCCQGLRQYLDAGKSLTFPDGVLINGQTQSSYSGDQGP